MKLTGSLILVQVLFSFSILSCTSDQKIANNHPNIIVILTDDQGYGDVSANDINNKIKTPYIDALASSGLRFTDAHTPSSVCTPTRYGLLTGRYNWRTRLKSSVLTGKSKALIPASRTTLASMLKQNGYQTAFIGKWHLGWDWATKSDNDTTGVGWNPNDFSNIDFTKPITNGPMSVGFEYSYGHSGSLDMAPYVYVENNQITQIPDTITKMEGGYPFWREGPTSKDFVHEQVTPNFFNRAIDYVTEKSKEEKPFFLYLALPSPHTPILPTEDWQGKSGINPYGDFVMMVDDYVGKLDRALKDAGIDENTIIVFTSDNGCSPMARFDILESKGHFANSHFRGAKADIFEGGHRVPFIVKWPKQIESNRVSDETICLTDLMATFANIVDYDLKDNEGEDSYSLLPILIDQQLNSPLREATVHHSINGSFAIRQGDWKLVLCPGSGGWSFPRPTNKEAIDSLPPIQLYNLAADPAETNNLAPDKPEVSKQMTKLLVKYINDGRSTTGTPQSNDDIDFEWKQVSSFMK